MVSANGGIRWIGDWVNDIHVLAGETVGLEEIDDGLWDVYFGRLKLGLVAVVMATVGIVACWIPAARARKIDPKVAVRVP